MSNTASATVKLSASVTYTNTANGTTYSGTPSIVATPNLSSSAITKVYESSGTISSPTTFNLTSVTSPYGASLDFASVQGFYFQNQSSGSASIVVGGGSNPVFGTDQYTVQAGIAFFQTGAFTVSGSAINILLTPSASCPYHLVVVGT